MEKGFTEVAALKGGMHAWKNAGYPMATGKPAEKGN